MQDVRANKVNGIIRSPTNYREQAHQQKKKMKQAQKIQKTERRFCKKCRRHIPGNAESVHVVICMSTRLICVMDHRQNLRISDEFEWERIQVRSTRGELK
jgi:hypothetical protein